MPDKTGHLLALQYCLYLQICVCVVCVVWSRAKAAPLNSETVHHGGDGQWSTGRGGCAEVSHSSSLHLPLKTKLLGKLRVEARRHAARRLADTHVGFTNFFSRGALSPANHKGLYQG